MNHSSRYLSKSLNNLRKMEEDSLQGNSFVGSIAKGYKYSLLIASIVGIGMGYFLSVSIQDPSVGMIFGTVGMLALLLLPTYFSYKCHVDKNAIKAQYFVLCFKVRKEVLWKDVKYKAVKRDSNGDALSIRLYNINKKKLIDFDYSIVGFEKIVRMSKDISKLK